MVVLVCGSSFLHIPMKLQVDFILDLIIALPQTVILATKIYEICVM